MNEEELDQLLEYQPADVYAWIHNVWEGFEQEPEHFNWLGLAEVAALYARRDKQGVPRPNLECATVAIDVYEYLIGQAPHPYRRVSLGRSIMNLRAYLIRQLGMVPGHPILAVADMEQWFFTDLKLSRDEAIQRSAYYKSRSREEIVASGKVGNRERLEIAMIKMKLSVFELLKSIVPLNEDLLLWLAIREQLL